MLRQAIYDAFTKLTLKEKTDVANFLAENNQGYLSQKSQILTAIDAVTKEIPSFGGHIITLYEEKNNNIIAAIIVNNTGMEGFAPSHIISFFAVKESHLDIGIEYKILQQALSRTKGEVIVRTQLNKQQKAALTEIGFKKSNIEILFSRKKATPKKSRKIARKITT